MILGSLAVLLVLAQDVPATPAAALVPEASIRATDDRPLLLIQQEFLGAVVDAEARASELEASLPETAGDPARADRVAKDRAMMAHMVSSLRTAPDLRPLSLSRGVLPAIDRYLLGFAAERLRSRQVVPVDELERWRAENERFLESRDLEVRDRAILHRDRILESMVASAQLAALIRRLDAGPLTDEERQAQVAVLQNLFPEASLPISPMSGGGGGGGPGAAQEPGPGSLPRLDGVEIPAVMLPDMSAPTASDIAGANEIALQMLQQQLVAGGAKKGYRPNVPPPRPRPAAGRAPKPRGRIRFPLGN